MKIEFSTDSAAYHFDGESEEVDEEAVSDTLRFLADLVVQGFTSGRIVDPNGNHVGDWSLNV